jgi:hypothetical protein
MYVCMCVCICVCVCVCVCVCKLKRRFWQRRPIEDENKTSHYLRYPSVSLPSPRPLLRASCLIARMMVSPLSSSGTGAESPYHLRPGGRSPSVSQTVFVRCVCEMHVFLSVRACFARSPSPSRSQRRSWSRSRNIAKHIYYQYTQNAYCIKLVPRLVLL